MKKAVLLAVAYRAEIETRSWGAGLKVGREDVGGAARKQVNAFVSAASKSREALLIFKRQIWRMEFVAATGNVGINRLRQKTISISKELN